MEALFFGEMCRRASQVARMFNTNLEAQKLWLRQHRPFMSIKPLEQTLQVGQVTRWSVLLLLIRFNWGVPARVPLFSLGLKLLGATAGGCYFVIAHMRLETRYIDFEKSISIIDLNFISICIDYIDNLR